MMKRSCLLPCLLCLLALSVCWAALAQTESPLPPVPELKPLVVPQLPDGVRPAVSTDKALSLDQAIELALARQPALGIARFSEVGARGKLDAARSAQKVKLSATGSVSHSEQSAGGGSSNSGNQSSLGFSGRKLITDSGRTKSQVSQAQFQQEAAVAGVVQAQNDLIYSVREAYYALLKSQQLLTVNERLVESQRGHLELAKARFSVGLAPKGDVVKAQTSVANALLNLATAQNDVALNRVSLNQAIGIDVRTPILVEDQAVPSPPETTLNDLVAKALSQRPEMLGAKASVEASLAGLNIAKKTSAPSLYASGNYSRQGSGFPQDSSSWMIGMTAAWDFHDAGLARANTVQSQSALDTARARSFQTELDIASEVTQAVMNVRSAQQKVEASGAEVANASESLRIATGRYEAGVAIFLEVTDAEAAKVSAEVNLVSARFQLTTAFAALKRAIGEN